MAEDSKIHTGHRRRMRSRVAENGFSSLEPHEALECLLYITNARKNTNRMAHELIDRFGDFAGVLDASEEDLMTVEGVGPATARMLHLMPDVCRYYTQCRTGRNGCLKTTEQLAEHLMGLFAGAAQERALLLALPGPGDALAQGRHQRPSEPCHQRRGGGSLEGRHRPGRALPQPPQRCGAALAGGHPGHREHRPGAGARPCSSAGPHHPDRDGVFFHAGGEPPAVL